MIQLNMPVWLPKSIWLDEFPLVRVTICAEALEPKFKIPHARPAPASHPASLLPLEEFDAGFIGSDILKSRGVSNFPMQVTLSRILGYKSSLFVIWHALWGL